MFCEHNRIGSIFYLGIYNMLMNNRQNKRVKHRLSFLHRMITFEVADGKNQWPDRRKSRGDDDNNVLFETWC